MNSNWRDILEKLVWTQVPIPTFQEAQSSLGSNNLSKKTQPDLISVLCPIMLLGVSQTEDMATYPWSLVSLP